MEDVSLALGLMAFLSTPSARRATHPLYIVLISFIISIHALREEGDMATIWIFSVGKISIHALREEGDRLLPGKLSWG